MPLLRSWNVLCWNVCGLNSEKKLLALSNAISVSGCAIVCLQETKRASFDLSYIKTFCPHRFDKFEFVPSSGASGGLITIWNSSAFDGNMCFSEIFAIGISFTCKLSGRSRVLCNVYGHF